MGPVISASARKTILEYIEIGKREGRLVAGEPRRCPSGGYFIPPTIIADVEPRRADLSGGDLRPGAGRHQGARISSTRSNWPTIRNTA